MLCNAASIDQSGLVSVLGAFIDRLAGPQLPVTGQLWLVARFDWEESDFDSQHTVTVRIERMDDGEQIARIDGSSVAEAVARGRAIDDDQAFELARGELTKLTTG